MRQAASAVPRTDTQTGSQVDFPSPLPLDSFPSFFRLFEMSFGTRVFAARQRQGSGCKSRAAAQL